MGGIKQKYYLKEKLQELHRITGSQNLSKEEAFYFQYLNNNDLMLLTLVNFVQHASFNAII